MLPCLDNLRWSASLLPGGRLAFLCLLYCRLEHCALHCQVLTLASQFDSSSKVEKLYSYAVTGGEDTRTGHVAPPTPRRHERFRTPSFMPDADSVYERTTQRAHSFRLGKPQAPSPVEVRKDLGLGAKVAPALSRLLELGRGRRAKMLVSSGSSSELHPCPATRFVPESMIASACPRLNGPFAESSGIVATEVSSDAATDAPSTPGLPASLLDPPALHDSLVSATKLRPMSGRSIRTATGTFEVADPVATGMPLGLELRRTDGVALADANAWILFGPGPQADDTAWSFEDHIRLEAQDEVRQAPRQCACCCANLDRQGGR